MSEIQLSPQLLRAVQEVLIQQDAAARDSGVAVQYLSGLIGYMVGLEDLSKSTKAELMEQLNAFSQHVMDDVDSRRRPAAPTGEAFGIWKPGDQ